MKKTLCYVIFFFVSYGYAYKLQLNWKAEPQFGGFYSAPYNDIQIIEGGSGTPTVQMLGNNAVDFAIVSAEEILIYNDKNPSKQIQALFAVYQENPQIIMCHSSRNFKSLKDVYSSQGILALQSGLSYSLFLDRKYPKSLIQKVPYLGGIGAFKADPQICQQGFLTAEPLLAKKSGISIDVFLVSKEGFNPYTTVLAAKKDFIAKNRGLIGQIRAQTHSGWKTYLMNPGATHQVIAKLNPSMTKEVLLESDQAQRSLIEKPNGHLGSMSEARWKELITQLKNLGLLKNDLKAKDQFVP